MSKGKNKVIERTFAECVEQLIIANIKLTIFDHLKNEELKKDSPCLENIAKWEKGSRSMNERRAEARSAVDEIFFEAITSGEYDYLKDARTFK